MVPLTQTIQNPPMRRDVDGFSSSWDDADQNIDDTRRTRPFRIDLLQVLNEVKTYLDFLVV